MGSDISSDSLDSKNDIIIDCTDADIDDEINVNSTNHKSISQFRNKSISSDVLINSLIKRSSSSYSNSPNLSRRRRSFSEGSSEDEYGWFEEIESPARPRSGSTESNNEVSLKRSTSLPIPVSETPIYVLESSIIAQKLWYETAGKRPKQPENERKYFENLWKSNFENSNIEHFKTSEYFISNINDKKSYYKKISDSFDDKEEEIIFKGRVPFSNSVSRSFIDQNFSTITIQMPRFKISRYTNNDCHASFLVIITVGGLAIGVWRRHSDFKNLADKVPTIFKILLLIFYIYDILLLLNLSGYRILCIARKF